VSVAKKMATSVPSRRRARCPLAARDDMVNIGRKYEKIAASKAAQKAAKVSPATEDSGAPP
jgi:hypothetical protein